MVWLYGWPIYRAGPMYWADQVGLKHVADRLAFYAEATDDSSLEPAPLLMQLAAQDKGFASLSSAAKAARGSRLTTGHTEVWPITGVGNGE